MAYTFDGVNKLVILSSQTTVDLPDLYSRWKDWVLLSDNSKYLEAMSSVGGDPLPSGSFLGVTFFLENGWKIRPQESSHTLIINGNLYDRAGGSPFTSTLGSFNVRIEQRTSNIVDLISVGGSILTEDGIADAVLNKADAIWANWNLQRAMRHILAAVAGKTAIPTPSQFSAFAPDGSTLVFSGVMDTDNPGVRSSVTPVV